MYCQYYGLKEKPFNVTSDPSFFYSSRWHEEAFSILMYGVTQRKGIIVLTGEIGTGKTTLCKFFLNQVSQQLNREVKTAFILNPYFSSVQLLEAIVHDFGIIPKKKSRLGLVWELNQYLLKENESGNNVVLIIDEAQNLSNKQLEQVRLLSNLETEKDKLLQIILVGQPELNQKLNQYDLRQLQQRISVRYHIKPLAHQEVKKYIFHRLRIAGSTRINFTDEAIEQITDFSCGTPRLINIICDHALLAGYVKETDVIDEKLIKQCIEELSTLKEKQLT